MIDSFLIATESAALGYSTKCIVQFFVNFRKLLALESLAEYCLVTKNVISNMQLFDLSAIHFIL